MIDDKRKAEIKECLINQAREFPIRQTLCDFCGISYDSFGRWMDPESKYYDEKFAEGFKTAESAGVMRLGKRATPEFLLATSKPDIFGKRNESNVNIEFKVTRDDASTSQHVRSDEPTPETTGSVG